MARDVTTFPRPGLRENVRLTQQMFSDPTRALDAIAERHGGCCLLGAGPLRMAIIGSPGAIREVMARRADAYVWGHRFQSIGPATFVGRQSMLGSDGADDTRRRGAVQAAFTRQRVNSLAAMIVERADSTIDSILAAARSGTPIDLYPFGRRLILGITLQALFGDRWSSRLDEVHARVLRAQRFIESPAIRQVPLPLPIGRRAGVRRDRRVLDQMIDEDLAFVRSQEPGSVDGLLGTLAFTDGLSDDEIRDRGDAHRRGFRHHGVDPGVGRGASGQITSGRGRVALRGRHRR